MSRATARTNIRILALPPNATEQEEEAKKEKKNAKKGVRRPLITRKKRKRPQCIMVHIRRLLYTRRS
ncbi:hypothetical protein GQ55_9G335200 [Panicum hallii var. hallii]|uniref:Uncharacterized protein n=1 Tax=Panicum hallii var. hallii TaxID=1504633 RepID=A0A2T7C8E5_9POAL|nr:hypothetical protein GQ55_9G335200 [Panicum hallii var. hallii]